MSVNRSYLGWELDPRFEHRVTAEELAAFADAIGDPNPVYRDAAAAADRGHRAIVAPPTYVATVAFRAQRPLFDDPHFGADARSLRHRDEHIRAYRSVHAGDLLHCAVRVVSIERVGNSDVLVAATSVEADGEQVALLRSTMVVVAP